MSDDASPSKRYFGKYRGTVINNVDPMQIGRIQAIVPDVSGVVPSSWAMPCLPGAGINTGVFTVPQVGSGVWIEFERGEASHPIWVGCFWNKGEVPDSASADVKSIVTSAGTLAFDNGASSVILQDSNQDSLSLDASGATLSAGAGKVALDTSGVSINDGALEVT